MSTYYVAGLPCSNELYHHGIDGMHWHVRRFQYLNGKLTPAGRERYGVGEPRNSEATDKFKKSIKNAGQAVGQAARSVKSNAAVQAVGRTARSATAYAATRTKMRHPSMMSDEDLRKYTQRLIAEKNYSDLMRYQQANSGLGRAKQYVGDILKRGGQTLADAGFRRIAQEITKTKDERALEKLKALKAKEERKEIKKLLNDEDAQAQLDEISRLQRETQLNEAQNKLDSTSAEKQAQIKELERMQREKQMNDLRNNLDSANIEMQRQINQLQQQKTLRDLQKQLDPSQNGGGLAAAMRIMGDPNSSASDIQEAKQILQNYNQAQANINLIAGRKPNDVIPSSELGTSTVASPSVTSAEPTYEMPRTYTPNTAARYNYGDDFGNYRMSSVDGTNGGMYGGRIADSRMATVESMSNPYRAPAISNSGTVRRPSGPSFADEDWYRMMLENARSGGVVRNR